MNMQGNFGVIMTAWKKSEGFVKAEPNKAVVVSNPQEMSLTEVITATQKNACFWIYFKIMDLFLWLMPF